MVGGRPWAEGNQIAVCTRLEQALSMGIDVAFLSFLFLWCRLSKLSFSLVQLTYAFFSLFKRFESSAFWLSSLFTQTFLFVGLVLLVVAVKKRPL